MRDDPLIEKLASYAHNIWAGWAWYMLSNNDAAHQERWRTQVKTGYKDLSESEKESDRHIARKWLDVIGQAGLANKVQELSELVEYLRERVAELEKDLERECVVCGKGAKPGTVDRLNERVAELETQCERCGLKLAHTHSGPPELGETYEGGRMNE